VNKAANRDRVEEGDEDVDSQDDLSVLEEWNVISLIFQKDWEWRWEVTPSACELHHCVRLPEQNVHYDVDDKFNEEPNCGDEWNSFFLDVGPIGLNHGHILEGAWTSRDSERDQRAHEEGVIDKVSQEAVSRDDDFSS